MFTIRRIVTPFFSHMRNCHRDEIWGGNSSDDPNARICCTGGVLYLLYLFCSEDALPAIREKTGNTDRPYPS